MRIHFVASTLVRGGAETMAVALSEKLAGRGHEVAWSLLGEPGELGALAAERMDLAARLGPGRVPVFGLPRLRARLAGAEALYALDHQNAVTLAALAAPWAGVRRRVVAIHTTGLAGGRPSLGRPFRRALAAYQAVLALSPAHGRYLAERENVPPEKLRVVPNGIDLDRFSCLPSREEARARLDLPGEAPVIGSVCMLRPEKNLGLLLEAAARLVPDLPGLRVVLIGEGPERAALEARAARDDLAGRVSFAGLRRDVPSVLPALDVFALPSRPEVETQPVSVLEAMAVQVPVVATHVGDVASLLEEGRAGELVPAGDAGALADALRRLLTDEVRRSSVRARGRSVAERFSLDASADALLKVLQEGAR